MKVKIRMILTITPIVIILDQITKYLAREYITSTREVISGFFNLVHVENRGGAWGIMANSPYNLPFFITVSSIAFVVLIIYFIKVSVKEKMLIFSLSLILGGAIGNFYDRIVRGSVTDFLDFYISHPEIAKFLKTKLGSNHWPAWNIADGSITVGVFLILFYMLFLEKRKATAQNG